MREISREYNCCQDKHIFTWLTDKAADISADFGADAGCGSMILCVAEGTVYVKNCAGRWQKFGTSEVI